VRDLWREKSPALCIPAFFILVWLFYIVGNPVQLWTWYTIPPSVAFFWTVTIPIGRWIAGREKLVLPAALAVALVFVGSIAVGVPKRLERMKLETWSLSDVADWIERDHPNAQTLALGDIGIIGFKTKKHIIDLASLVTRTTAKMGPDGKLISYGDILQEQHPDILLLRGDPRGTDLIEEAMVKRRSFNNPAQRAWFDRNYEPVDLHNAWFTGVFVRKGL
jgi:hypothetical protein